MTNSMTYLLDSDVFITAKNAYYAFEICPGFWKGLLREYEHGRVYSIDRVRAELLLGRPEEDLVHWVRKTVPEPFFRECTSDVTTAFSEIILWTQRHPRYSDQAKAKFATGADGWLVAYAKVHNAVVVTNEKPASESRAVIKLPDVCNQFNVLSKDTFVMLKELALKFDLAEIKQQHQDTSMPPST